MTDLVQQLKQLHRDNMDEIASNIFDEPNTFQETKISLYFYEAADRIEALEAEIERLKRTTIPIAGNRPDLAPTEHSTFKRSDGND